MSDNQRGREWTCARNWVLDRDDETCQRCGTTNQNEDSYVGMHVHHIVKEDDVPDGENPHLDLNLVTVCVACHIWLEGKPIDVQLAETGRKTLYEIVTAAKKGWSIDGIAAEIGEGKDSVRTKFDDMAALGMMDAEFSGDKKYDHQSEQAESDFSETELGILRRLEEGRCTPAYLADELDVTQEYVRDRLRDLVRLGLVNRVYRGLYELEQKASD